MGLAIIFKNLIFLIAITVTIAIAIIIKIFLNC